MSPAELRAAIAVVTRTMREQAAAGRIEAFGVVLIDHDGKVSQFLATTSVRGADALSDAGGAMQDAATSMTSNSEEPN